MSHSINSFKASHSHYSLYNAQVEFEILAKLFGDWFVYNMLVQYSNKCVDLVVATTLTSCNHVHVHVWINSQPVNQEIKFKNIGSPLIYLLDDLVASGVASKQEV